MSVQAFTLLAITVVILSVAYAARMANIKKQHDSGISAFTHESHDYLTRQGAIIHSHSCPCQHP